MAQKQKLTKVLRTFLLGNPSATVDDIIRATNASRRTIYYVKQQLVKEGLLPSNRRLNAPKASHEGTEEPLTPEPPDTYETLDAETLEDMIASDSITEELEEADEETRTKILKEVKRIAFDKVVHPDTRMSAMSLWVKIKDVAKSKDLGPGPPRSKDEILERLSRLMLACGAKLTLEAFEFAFKKDKADEKAPNQQAPVTSGASQTSYTV